MATAIQTISGNIESQPLNDNFSFLNAKVATAQADSTATAVDTLRADLNSLLAKLRSSGLMST